MYKFKGNRMFMQKLINLLFFKLKDIFAYYWIACSIIEFFWFAQVLKLQSFVYDTADCYLRSNGAIRYLMAKCFY